MPVRLIWGRSRARLRAAQLPDAALRVPAGRLGGQGLCVPPLPFFLSAWPFPWTHHTLRGRALSPRVRCQPAASYGGEAGCGIYEVPRVLGKEIEVSGVSVQPAEVGVLSHEGLKSTFSKAAPIVLLASVTKQRLLPTVWSGKARCPIHRAGTSARAGLVWAGRAHAVLL